MKKKKKHPDGGVHCTSSAIITIIVVWSDRLYMVRLQASFARNGSSDPCLLDLHLLGTGVFCTASASNRRTDSAVAFFCRPIVWSEAALPSLKQVVLR